MSEETENVETQEADAPLINVDAKRDRDWETRMVVLLLSASNDLAPFGLPEI